MSDFTTLIEKLGIPVAFSIFMFLYFKGTIDKSNSERVEMSKQMIMLMETNNTYLQTLVKDSMSEIKCKYK